MSAKQPDIAVKYIFRRPRWVDTIYGTGLEFTTDQVRKLPAHLALKFLRHTDTFVRADALPPEQQQERQQELTDEQRRELEAAKEQQELLEAKKKQQEDEAAYEQARHDLMQQFEAMTKDALVAFAREKYDVTLDKSLNKEALKAEARSLVDRFGVPA
jgi:type IV secretory pathway VirB10-like protein